MFSIVILFIIILGILVLVHELGHFVVARRNGIRVDEFGFGFPPRAAGIVKNEKTGKWEVVGGKTERRENTIYSLNWIPLGGFVRIKGEDGADANDPDSFPKKSPWTRIKVLGAGVAMNFVLAWFVLSSVFMIGAPKAVSVDEDTSGAPSAVVVGRIAPGSPAEAMGMKVGDEIVSVGETAASVTAISDVQKYISARTGGDAEISVQRGKDILALTGTPRANPPEGEGALGIEMVRTTVVQYGLLQSLWEGLVATGNITMLILTAFGGLIASLFSGGGVAADIAGPVGIAYLTKQVADLGLVYVLQFAAVLSINLGILNILPIPALDGGRIFFVLMELVKGSPVSRVFEQRAHTIGFVALLLLMLVVTAHDFLQFDIFSKIWGIFS